LIKIKREKRESREGESKRIFLYKNNHLMRGGFLKARITFDYYTE